MRIRLKTFDPRKQQYVIVGVLEDENFFKTIKKKHYMQKVRGYGIQENVFQTLVKKGIRKITLIDNKSNIRYESSINDWIQKDIKVLDYGNGKQRFLPVNRMKIGNAT